MISESLSERPLDWLAERCDVARVRFDDPAFDDALAVADGLVVRTYTVVDEDLLERSPRLRVVGRAGVALDNIDVPACRGRGVEVVHAPGANSSAVAEYVFALIFDALRPRAAMTRAMDLEEFNRVRGELLAPRQLEGMTLGVLGYGRIGARVGRIGRAFGMRVIYHDLLEITEDRRHGAEPVSRDELFERSEVLTVHIDDRPDNRRTLGAGAFGRMRGDVVFLNCARGLVVDPQALAGFMIDHPAAMALLDVHDPEPFGPTYPLLDIRNVHLFPHIAAATAAAKENMSWVVRDVVRVLEGERPEWAAPA